MSEPAPDLADIDAALAKGEWWLRILEELAEAGVALASQLAGDVKAGRRRPQDAADDYARVAAAVRAAVAMTLRLQEALRGLASLRACTLQDIAAAEAKAHAKANAEARERREARKAEVRKRVTQAIEREAADPQDRENLCLTLEERLSFDPAYTDIDSLPLRETVERICADLNITPDWSRWETEDWNPPNPMFHGPWPPPRPHDPDDPDDLEESLAAETAARVPGPRSRPPGMRSPAAGASIERRRQER